MSTVAPPLDKLVPFSVSTFTYKIVDGHSILADVIVPKKLFGEGPGSPKWKAKRPVIVRYHGGWLIGGQRQFLPWWPRWVLDIALKQDAIIAVPDYRLLPEATAEEILDDIHDFWKWLGNEFSVAVRNEYPGLQPDLDRVFLVGESAGGYLALQTALSFYKPEGRATESGLRIRVAAAQYPLVSIRTPIWTQDYHKEILGQPQYPNSKVDNHLAAIAAARTSTGKQPVETNIPMMTAALVPTPRAQLAVAIQQRGRYVDILGPERDTSHGKRRLHHEDRIEDGAVLPPVLFVHGVDDQICPVEGTDAFIEHLRKYQGIDGLAQGKAESEVLKYCKVPGEHLFDTEVNLSEDTDEWVKDAAAFVEKNWLE
ncbi:hypothetical protein EW145_g4129 [Phellinidium pouzarii]|uniref:Alpha/beta hydrolase fold-3 domain-containing protein n=1 Tax=Phellinidium pouzarii TaxID=167371 RepID=A0A4S4L4W3_9AGAM|nr:hypothetical protein EW145_g4129 [Phellinidium pouzarii]